MPLEFYRNCIYLMIALGSSIHFNKINSSNPLTQNIFSFSCVFSAWSWNSNTLATWCKELTHLKRPWYWERLKAGEVDDRAWDGWMASPTQWTWVWVNSGSWWWTGRPAMLWSMGPQRVGHDWATELNFQFLHQCFIAFINSLQNFHLLKFIPKNFILFDAVAYGIIFLISLSDNLLLVYRNATIFLYIYFVSCNFYSNSFLVVSFGYSVYNVMSSANSESFSSSQLKKKFLVYLAVLGLSCSTQDLWSSLWYAGCFSCDVWILSCGMWDLVSWPGIVPGPPTMGAQSLSHWTTRKVSLSNLYVFYFFSCW